MQNSTEGKDNGILLILDAMKSARMNNIGDCRILGKLTDINTLTDDEIKKAEQILSVLAGTSIYSAKRILEAADTAALFTAFIP